MSDAPAGARWLELHTGRRILVDADDYDRIVAEGSWADDGRCGSRGFGYGRKNRTNVRLPHFILGLPNAIIIDHRGGNPSDCRRQNLRPATATESIRNRSKQHRNGPPASKYKGVTLKKDQPRTKPWAAGIRIGARRITLGHFADEVDAAKAYDAAAREHFGEFAAFNFARPGERSALDP